MGEIRGLGMGSFGRFRVMAGWEEKWSYSWDRSTQSINPQSFVVVEQLNFFPLSSFSLPKDDQSQVVGDASWKCFSYIIQRASSICDNSNKAETSRSVCRHGVIKPIARNIFFQKDDKLFFSHGITPTSPPLLLAVASVYVVLYRLK